MMFREELNAILKQIEKLQSKWGDSVVEIGSLNKDKRACQNATEKMLKELYAFDLGEVLFKPTRVSKKQFRLSFEGAKSYFIGDNPLYNEDKGFALHPWVNVKFDNISVVLKENHAIAMGNYYFTDPQGKEVKVEYTFGYLKDSMGNIKINLHHSSFPYNDDLYFE